MTAAIVTEFSRDPYDPATVFKFGANGDVKRRDTPGQLWERVAESHAPVDTNTDGIPDNCAVCGCAVHTDAYTGRLVHGFDPAL